MDKNNSELTAFFEPIIENAVIKAELISGGSGGNVEFKDPWFINYEDDPPRGDRNLGMTAPFEPIQSPFNLIEHPEYKGIIKDQIISPNRPYYSIRASEEETFSAHGEDFTGYFLNWDADPELSAEFQNANNLETPVVFRQNNATVTAKYKGHLASDNPEATAFNNSRRIVKDDNEVLHVVYEDNKNIWYTKSTNDGETWSDEELITYTYFGFTEVENIYPAMALVGNTLYVTYLQVWSGSYRIYYATKDLSGGGWSYELFIYDGNDLSLKSKPSIAILQEANYNRIMVAFEIESAGVSYIKSRFKLDNGSSWVNANTFEGKTPSVASDNINNTLYIVYEDNDRIYGRRWYCWVSGLKMWGVDIDNDGYPDDTGYHLTEGVIGDYFRNPSLSLHSIAGGCYGYLVWEIYSDCQPQQGPDSQIGCRTFSTEGPWLWPISIFEGYQIKNPVISSWGTDPSFTAGVTIFHEEAGQIVKKTGEIISINSTNWSDKVLGNGTMPNVISNDIAGLNNQNATAVWTSGDNPPFLLKNDFDDGLQVGHYTDNFKRFKFFFTEEENGGQEGTLTLDLIALSMNNEELELDEEENSEEVNVPNNNIPLSYAVIAMPCDLTSSIDYNETVITFYLNDGEYQYSLNSLALDEILNSDGTPIEDISQQDITILNLPADQGSIEVRCGNQTALVNDVYVNQDSLSSYLAKRGIITNDPLTPKAYSLHQNYPNPFNPITTIQFDLPEAGKTKLIVYDIRGRVVSTLVNSHLNEGRYSYIFKSQNLASGLYFYQLTSGKFRKINKMMLVK